MVLWTQDQIDFLEEFYPVYGSEYISEKLRKSCNAIRRKASTIGLKFKRMKDHKICKVDGCDGKYRSKGYCGFHYRQAVRRGEFSTTTCKNLDCNSPAVRNGFCSQCGSKDYYEKNKDRISEYHIEYRKDEDNKKRMAQYQRDYDIKNASRVKRVRKQYKLDHKERLVALNKISHKERSAKYYLEAFNMYDNQCQNCGNDDLLVLEWHHRNNTKKSGENGDKIARAVVLNKDRIEDIMLLCACCHVKQNIIDGTGNKGVRMLRIMQGITTHPADIPIRIALGIYEKKCQCCDEDNVLVLQWHHRNNNKNNKQSSTLARRIRDAGEMLDDIMLLCANCHIHQDLEDGTSNRGARTFLQNAAAMI